MSVQRTHAADQIRTCVEIVRLGRPAFGPYALAHCSRMSFPRRARMGPCGNIGAYYSRIGNTFDRRSATDFRIPSSCAFSPRFATPRPLPPAPPPHPSLHALFSSTLRAFSHFSFAPSSPFLSSRKSICFCFFLFSFLATLRASHCCPCCCRILGCANP